MATRLFEDREHAALYKKYRFSPQKNLQDTIFSYLEEKRNPFHLAIDVGCGSGQSTQVLAKRFEKVVGVDISEAQIMEAKQAAHAPNISYLVSPAEQLPFEDSSVDLLTAFASVHWFDIPRFVKEVDRVLKPSGCIAFSCYKQIPLLCYEDRTEKLTEIFKKAQEWLFTFEDAKVNLVKDDYQEIFDALPFQDKKRITGIVDKVSIGIDSVVGYLKSLSMYHTALKLQPEAAKSLLQNMEKRLLETMGTASGDAQVELHLKHVCILACKNSQEKC